MMYAYIHYLYITGQPDSLCNTSI